MSRYRDEYGHLAQFHLFFFLQTIRLALALVEQGIERKFTSDTWTRQASSTFILQLYR